MLFSRKAKKARLVGKTDAVITPRQDSPTDISVARRVGEGAYMTADPQSELTLGDYAGGVRRIPIAQMIRVFLSQLRWAIPLFLIGCVAAFWATRDFQRSYTGQGRVLAQIASEYVYDPVAGQASPGLMITPDHIVLNEVGIMTSPTVIRRVLGDLAALHGFAAVDPINAGKLRPGQAPGDNPDIYRSFEKNLFASPQAKSSVIDMGFQHSDPEIAVDGLNLFIDAYLQERQTLFVSGTADAVSRRREATDEQLRQNEAEIAAFLRRNSVSDFESERKGATERTEALKTELNTLRGTMAETERALREVEDQVRFTPASIDLFVDDRASQRVAQAELELKQLLAKYLPGSDPVRQKQVEIAELKSLQAANGGRAMGGRRVGPNPVHQGLMTRRNELAAQADSYREKEIVLQAQLNSADSKTRRLRDLSPRMENLLRERETLQARLRGLNTKEQEALIAQQQAQAASENIRVISRPTSAVKGRNMRMLMWVGLSLVWGVVVALLSLLATFLSPKLVRSTPGPAVSRNHGTLQAGGRRADDYDIPEPVAPYIPAIPEPATPAYAPAAVMASASPMAPPYIHDDSAEPAPMHVAQATGTDGPQVYAEVPAALYRRMEDGGAPALQTRDQSASVWDSNPYL